jgi:hypothetical protein
MYLSNKNTPRFPHGLRLAVLTIEIKDETILGEKVQQSYK